MKWFRAVHTIWWNWRIRPGLELAAQLAERAAYGNKNTQYLGPELNLLRFSELLRKLDCFQ